MILLLVWYTFCTLGLLALLWLVKSTIRMYMLYFFYKRQGMTHTFPWPLLGNMLLLKDVIKEVEKKYPTDFVEAISNILFKDKKMPDVYFDFTQNPEGMVVVNSPEIVHELYGPKNKYFSKDDAQHRKFYDLFGDGIVFAKSDAVWAAKRKHLSAAFYKERLIVILNHAIKTTNLRVTEWIETYGKTGKNICITQQISSLLMECIDYSVFGINSKEERLDMVVGGVPQSLSPGNALRELSNCYFQRSIFRFHHVIFPFLNRFYIGKEEQDVKKNLYSVKNFILMLIERRRKEMKDGQASKGDFLTLLLEDELYAGNDRMIADECITIIFAATQTTNLLIANTTYFMIKDPKVSAKAREEVQRLSKRQNFKNLTDEEWQEILNYENIDSFEYISNCLNETMRIKPQVERSGGIELTEPVEILGKQYRADVAISINIWYLHHDPTQWQSPNEYIPERFDPTSKFYLAPSGQKRHPMSYGPFLGGKRICLGKTFAEKLVRCILPIS